METKNTYVSFQEWKKEFFQIEKKDLTKEISDKWGVSQEMLFEDTKTIRIYKYGGYYINGVMEKYIIYIMDGQVKQII